MANPFPQPDPQTVKYAVKLLLYIAVYVAAWFHGRMDKNDKNKGGPNPQ